MPIDPSIALGFKQPDQTQQLSSLLGVANSAQTLQQNQQRTQQGGIDLQERQAMQRVMSDPTNYTDPQGNFDPMKAQQNIMRAAPTTGTKYWQEIASAHKMSTEATSALNTLTAQNRSVIGGALASLPADAPKELVHKTVDALNDQFGGRIGPLVDVFKRGYENASKGGPKAATDYVLQSARSVLPQETQQSMNTPSVMTLDNGQQTVGVNVKPGVQGIPQGAPVQGTMVQKVLPPGQQQQVATDSQGSPYVVHRDSFGNITGSGAMPGAANSPQPTAGGPFALPPGETADTLKLVQGIRANANQAAKTVPDQQFNANQIIKLAKETNTGVGAGIVAGLKGGASGIPWTTDSATNYNQLGHYMALQTSQLSQSAGLGGTDAAHSIAAEQAGKREWTQDAIQGTARVNRALSTGTDLFNRGVESAVQSGGPFAAREFQNKWSKTASVEALRVYDAYKNRQDDPDGWKTTVQELGGPTSEKFKRTMQHVDAMRELVRGK